MQRVPGKLEVKRLARLHALLHEFFGSLRHPEDIHGVWVVELEGLFISCISIVLVVTVVSRTTTADMPLTIMSRRVTGSLEHFADGRLGSSDAFDEFWFDQLLAGFGRCGLGPMQLRWTLACLQTDPRRGTDRSGRIGVRETHAACGESFEVRGVEPLSSRCWHFGVHGYR